MTLIAEGTAKNVEQTVRKAALVADQVAVLATPVDTGRARAAWLVSVGSPREGKGTYEGKAGERETNEGPATSAALTQGAAEIAKYDLEAGSIFLQNNLSYIGELDEGSSAQAPEGMTAAAIQAASEVIKKAKVVPDGV